MSTEKDQQISYIKERIKDAGACIDDRQAGMFLTYYTLLEKKNEVMNLTAVSDFEGVVKTHFADSLSIVRVIDFTDVKNVIDIGSGAGFPGLPLAILHPEIRFVLLDSLNKRIGFLNEVIAALNLKNVTALHARAEDGARAKEHRERYDLAVSRAVSNLSTLSEYCLPYVNLKGAFVSYKSDQAGDEIKAAENAAEVLGGKIEKTETFRLNDTGRCLVVIRKIKKTPAMYPRKAGIPGKDPINPKMR